VAHADLEIAHEPPLCHEPHYVSAMDAAAQAERMIEKNTPEEQQDEC